MLQSKESSQVGRGLASIWPKITILQVRKLRLTQVKGTSKVIQMNKY